MKITYYFPLVVVLYSRKRSLKRQTPVQVNTCMNKVYMCMTLCFLSSLENFDINLDMFD